MPAVVAVAGAQIGSSRELEHAARLDCQGCGRARCVHVAHEHITLHAVGHRVQMPGLVGRHVAAAHLDLVGRRVARSGIPHDLVSIVRVHPDRVRPVVLEHAGVDCGKSAIVGVYPVAAAAAEHRVRHGRRSRLAVNGGGVARAPLCPCVLENAVVEQCASSCARSQIDALPVSGRGVNRREGDGVFGRPVGNDLPEIPSVVAVPAVDSRGRCKAQGAAGLDCECACPAICRGPYNDITRDAVFQSVQVPGVVSDAVPAADFDDVAVRIVRPDVIGALERSS